MDVCPRFSVLCCPVSVEALQRADPPSKESDQMSRNRFISFRSQILNQKNARGPNPNLLFFLLLLLLLSLLCSSQIIVPILLTHSVVLKAYNLEDRKFTPSIWYTTINSVLLKLTDISRVLLFLKVFFLLS
jgi:hypothetical protein